MCICECVLTRIHVCLMQPDFEEMVGEMLCACDDSTHGCSFLQSRDERSLTEGGSLWDRTSVLPQLSPPCLRG